MTQRSDELANKANQQLEQIIAFLRTVSQEDLDRPDPDRPARTLADAAAHMAEGYHLLGRFLEAQVFAPEKSAGHMHGRPASLRLPDIVSRAEGARPAAARIAGISDAQLDSVPSKGSSRFSDGLRTVGETVEAVIDHQEEHLASLRAALGSPASAPAESRA